MTRDATLLTDLLSQPTAPFREQHVIDFVVRILERKHVPYFLDPAGNVIVGVASHAAYHDVLRRATREPVRVFIAHLDHPGFHGVRWRGNRLQVKWFGGGPTRHLDGAPVWIANDNGNTYRGIMRDARLTRSRHSIESADVIFDETMSGRPAAQTLYGGFGFRAPVWKAGNRLYTKAADDLVGAYALLMTAIAHARSNSARGSFLGILTRAEEVGFIGAIAHLQLGWLQRAKRPVLAISLETSRTLPGAIIGKGPVVRLGDRRTVFNADAINVLTQIAERALPGRYQRRIMDGGTCEATAATVFGIPAIGISVPLGNYHNEGFEGGPDCRRKRGPAPEFVDQNDINGMVILCRKLLQKHLPWDQPWLKEQRNYRKRLKKSHKLLVATSKNRHRATRQSGY